MTVNTGADRTGPCEATMNRGGGYRARAMSVLRSRAALAGPLIAAVALGGAIAATGEAGVPLRDPGDVSLRRLWIALALATALLALDVLVRHRTWSRGGLLTVLVTIVSFHVTYFAYRNVKSVIPLLAPGDLYDRRLGDLERSVFGGDPAEFLHALLGTGTAAHVLSVIYMLFFAFVPLALTGALVFSRKLETGLFFATALALNWVLAAISYRLLPALGPIYADPGAFAALPVTEVSKLQVVLLDRRTEFLADPTMAGGFQSIGAFASLHTSLYVTAGLAAHLLGYPRLVKAAIWTGLAGTVLATVYFGWHYLVDDLAGVLIALVSLGLARVLTGFHPRTVRQPEPVPLPSTSPA